MSIGSSLRLGDYSGSDSVSLKHQVRPACFVNWQEANKMIIKWFCFGHSKLHVETFGADIQLISIVIFPASTLALQLLSFPKSIE
jgi:hypothetical protein